MGVRFSRKRFCPSGLVLGHVPPVPQLRIENLSISHPAATGFVVLSGFVQFRLLNVAPEHCRKSVTLLSSFELRDVCPLDSKVLILKSQERSSDPGSAQELESA